MSASQFSTSKIWIWNCHAETYYLLGMVHAQIFPLVSLYLESSDFGLPLQVGIHSGARELHWPEAGTRELEEAQQMLTDVNFRQIQKGKLQYITFPNACCIH